MYSIISDIEARTVTIYLSNPATPCWAYPVLVIPLEGLSNFIQGLGEAARLFIEGKDEKVEVPKYIVDFIDTL